MIEDLLPTYHHVNHELRFDGSILFPNLPYLSTRKRVALPHLQVKVVQNLAENLRK